MKNFKKVALALMVSGLAIGFSAFTNAHHSKFAGAYYYNQPTPQAWNAPTLDQKSTDYSLISGQTYDCTETSNICTYDLVNGHYVQATEGDNSLAQ